MKDELESLIKTAVKDLFSQDVNIELTRPEEQFGDYALNIAMQLANQQKANPKDIAERLAEKLRQVLTEQISEVTVAGPGFINLKLNDKTLLKALDSDPSKSLANKVVVAEYSDPNPFKVLHAGHLYTSVVGDSIANLLENAGATVHRVNFGGDVGLHVAKSMWGILKKLGGEHPEKLVEQAPYDFADWCSDRYVEGNEAYDNNEQAKAEIVDINKRIYKLHEQNDHDSPFAKIYWTCRQWSYDYFEWFYEIIGSKFEKYYPESETAPIGLKTVREHIGDVYKESNGAIIFEGEKHDLHTRVFINSEGLPTYEAKDVGLIMKKWQDYHFDRSVVITANEIDQYMKVVLESLKQFEPKLVEATTHLTHGVVKLTGGQKMSSRKGNIIRATDVLEAANAASQELYNNQDDTISIGAVKFSFLKQRLGGDIMYDPKESVSLEGNSGPYLQYAHARARSILAKAKTSNEQTIDNLEDDERSLARKIGEYPEEIAKAVYELKPHYICTYLYELAQTFNRFYEHNRVLGDKRQALRLKLVDHYAQTLKKGLSLLGIAAPEKL